MSSFIDDLETELRAAERRRLRLAAAGVPRPSAAAAAVFVSVAVCLAVCAAILVGHPAGRLSPGGQHRTSLSGQALASGGWRSHFPLIAPSAQSASARSAPDALNGRFRSQVLGVARGATGRTLKLTATGTRIVHGPSGWQLAVVPGAGGACILARFPATSARSGDGAAQVTACDRSHAIMRHGLLAVGLNHGSYYLVGLVPSGNSSVTVGVAGGHRVRLPVARNTVMRSLGAAAPESVTLVNGYGSATTRTYRLGHTRTLSSPATATVAPAGCTPTQLGIHRGTILGGAGSAFTVFSFVNVSGRTCELYGYPGVSGVLFNGHVRAFATTRSDRTDEHTVDLAPGQSAAFTLRTAWANEGGGSCVHVHRLRFIPPGDYSYEQVAYPTWVCADTVGVTPVGSARP